MTPLSIKLISGPTAFSPKPLRVSETYSRTVSSSSLIVCMRASIALLIVSSRSTAVIAEKLQEPNPCAALVRSVSSSF